uniref:ATP-binding protein n=1 Tax=Pantanalinema rosaneae TaxID=1620701 RepID=UPI003D6FD133
MDQPRMTLRLPPGTEEVARLLDEVEVFAEEAGIHTALAMRLALVAEELAANVVMHGTGAGFFAFTATVTEAGVAILFEDDGPEFDPLAAPAAATGAGVDSREVGGLGLHLLRKMTRDAAWERQGGVNRLTCLLPDDA